jgi:hypothetical protein
VDAAGAAAVAEHAGGTHKTLDPTFQTLNPLLQLSVQPALEGSCVDGITLLAPQLSLSTLAAPMAQVPINPIGLLTQGFYDVKSLS